MGQKKKFKKKLTIDSVVLNRCEFFSGMVTSDVVHYEDCIISPALGSIPDESTIILGHASSLVEKTENARNNNVFTNCWCSEQLLINEKSDISDGFI